MGDVIIGVCQKHNLSICGGHQPDHRGVRLAYIRNFKEEDNVGGLQNGQLGNFHLRQCEGPGQEECGGIMVGDEGILKGDEYSMISLIIKMNIEKVLNSILEERAVPKKIPICHVNDMENFYNPMKFKDVPCRFYLANSCHKGSDCEFSHAKEHLKSQKYKTELCKNYMEGKCKYSDHCTFAHGSHELRKQ